MGKASASVRSCWGSQPSLLCEIGEMQWLPQILNPISPTGTSIKKETPGHDGGGDRGLGMTVKERPVRWILSDAMAFARANLYL